MDTDRNTGQKRTIEGESGKGNGGDSQEEHRESVEDYVIYEDEFQILDWEDSSRGGMTVRFRINAIDYDTHPFKRFPLATRFYCRMIEIGDDDQPIDQAQREKMRKAMQDREIKGGTIARDAGILCGDSRFQEFVVDRLLNAAPADKRAAALQMPPTILSALQHQKKGILDDPRIAGEMAKWWIYDLCKIKSRRELDHKLDCRNRYYQFVVKPYTEWKPRPGG